MKIMSSVATLAAGFTVGLAGVGGLVMAGSAGTAPNVKPATGPEPTLVGGEPIGGVVYADEMYRAGDCRIDTKLPVGYPRPTAPGAMELKAYPMVRRAEVRMGGDAGSWRSSTRAFFPLFQHISSRDIAMTAPVEMEFEPGEDGRMDFDSMSFLYEKFEDGPAGDGEGIVKVVDAEPVMVVSLGVKGVRSTVAIREAVQKLEAWATTAEDWASTGDYRWLSYNGPSVRPANQWHEVQLILEALEPETEEAVEAKP